MYALPRPILCAGSFCLSILDQQNRFTDSDLVLCLYSVEPFSSGVDFLILDVLFCMTLISSFYILLYRCKLEHFIGAFL